MICIADIGGMMETKNATVVVTGASSGLGRAVAHAFARQGAHVVLAARHKRELEHAAQECRAFGATAIPVATDVTNEAAVKRLGQAALDALGTIDVWVNNAAVTYFAPLEEGDMAEHRAILDTNVIGYIHGARTALPVFKDQGRGVLINVSSVLGVVGHPYVQSYVISKFADRGLSEALRASLADYPDIHVSTILPFSIDTPHFLVADNILGKLPIPIPPLQSPEKVANAIVDITRRPRHQRYVPRYIQAGVLLKHLFPTITDRMLLHTLQRFHFAGPMKKQVGSALRPGKIRGTVHGEEGPAASMPRVLAFAARDAGLTTWRSGVRRMRRRWQPQREA